MGLKQDDVIPPDKNRLPSTQEEQKTPGARHKVENLEQSFIEKLKAKDDKAWNNFNEWYTPSILRAIKWELVKRGMGFEHVEDIAQTTRLMIFEKIGTFAWKENGKFHSWVRSYARNCTLTFIHDESRKVNRKPISIEELQEADIDPESAYVPNDFLVANGLCVESAESAAQIELFRRELRNDFMPLLAQALRELSARDRVIVLRHILFKETAQKIADAHSMNVSTVNSVIRRAKEKLYMYLLARGFFAKGGLE